MSLPHVLLAAMQAALTVELEPVERGSEVAGRAWQARMSARQPLSGRV